MIYSLQDIYEKDNDNSTITLYCCICSDKKEKSLHSCVKILGSLGAIWRIQERKKNVFLKQKHWSLALLSDEGIIFHILVEKILYALHLLSQKVVGKERKKIELSKHLWPFCSG